MSWKSILISNAFLVVAVVVVFMLERQGFRCWRCVAAYVSRAYFGCTRMLRVCAFECVRWSLLCLTLLCLHPALPCLACDDNDAQKTHTQKGRQAGREVQGSRGRGLRGRGVGKQAGARAWALVRAWAGGWAAPCARARAGRTTGRTMMR